MRDKTGKQVGALAEGENSFTADVSGAKVVLIDDDMVNSRNISERLNKSYVVQHFSEPTEGFELLKTAPAPDVILISTMLSDVDGLRMAAQFKNVEQLRHVPIIVLVDEEETHLMFKGLELGINDYLSVPVELNEMEARIKTQIRRKKYQDALRSNYQVSVSMAITDKLTGLYNRNFLDAHIQNIINQSLINQKAFSIMMLDMDHFKLVNDTYGHDVGDEVLRELAKRMVNAIRSSDLAARIGGEEFMILMPETGFADAYNIADRMRAQIARDPFPISHEIGHITKTISIGVSELNLSNDNAAALIKRADNALYEAKNNGRNRVCPQPKIVPVNSARSGGLKPLGTYSAAAGGGERSSYSEY